MTSDHYFEIGEKQYANGAPCQDYAFSGDLMSAGGRPRAKELQWAAVADGCGGARSETDLGARAIVWAFRHALQARAAAPLGLEEQSRGAWIDMAFEGELKEAFAYPRISMQAADYFATLVGIVTDDTDAQVLLWGDGAVGLSYSDGRHRLVIYEFEGNAPFYLAYTMSDKFLRQYLKYHAAPVRERTVEYTFVPGGQANPTSVVDRQLDFETFRHGHLLNYKPKQDGISSIAIFSDGIMSLLGVEPWQVASQLMDIKSTRGGFVKQRAREVLSSYRQAGNPARDDVAVAVCSYCR